MLSLRSLTVVAGALSCVNAGLINWPPKPVNYWFAFGDSYTTIGFEPNGTLPSVGNPLGNPAFPGDTGGGGENFVGFDTLTYNKSLILTYDYAVGGAVIDPTLVAPLTLSLPDEVDQFVDGAAKKPENARWTSENALFSVWIGINDIGNTFFLGGDRDAFADLLLDRYFAQVQRLVRNSYHLGSAGARQFLFINVPPTYRAPLIMGFFPDQLDVGKIVIEHFNAKLSNKIREFERKNRGVKTWTWDSYTLFNRILDSPRKYGFNDNVTSHGEQGDFWGNSYHPSSPAHRIFAKEISKELAWTRWFWGSWF
ncbi:family 16 carbohydrate esterase [Favolaschia claudopus]|uniref:Family 16 carbohydrate esterase n=1 Tax=Favolaschia claudopus TaxID=2862362 RepID=A0AAV9ZVW4_9AGAR